MADVLIRPEAEGEIQAGYDWYESQRRGLGDEYLGEIESSISVIASSPQFWPVIHGEKVRRHLLKRFPYSMYYLLDSGRVVVVAVLHQRQSLGQLEGRGG